MINTCPFYIVFQVLKVLLIKVCEIQPLDLLFFAAFISFYTSPDIRYQKKKIFITNFPFLMDSLKPPTPLMAKIC